MEIFLALHLMVYIRQVLLGYDFNNGNNLLSTTDFRAKGWLGNIFKDIYSCPIEIIKGFIDMKQFQYLTN